MITERAAEFFSRRLLHFAENVLLYSHDIVSYSISRILIYKLSL